MLSIEKKIYLGFIFSLEHKLKNYKCDIYSKWFRPHCKLLINKLLAAPPCPLWFLVENKGEERLDPATDGGEGEVDQHEEEEEGP